MYRFVPSTKNVKLVKKNGSKEEFHFALLYLLLVVKKKSDAAVDLSS